MKRSRILVAVFLSVEARPGFGPRRPLAPNDIFDKLAPSTVIFYDLLPDGSSTVAAGVLVDLDKRLVVTAERVVHRVIRDGTFKTSVMFPVMDKAGKVNTNAALYLKKRLTLSIPGERHLLRPHQGPSDRSPGSSAARRQGDPRQPAGHRARRQDPPRRQFDVLRQGRPSTIAPGTVRNQFYMNKKTVNPAGAFRDLIYFTLCNDIPSNHGDSGGPTVNAKGELVAVVSRGTPDASNYIQVVDTSVHVREISRALDGVQQPSGNTPGGERRRGPTRL